MPRAAKRAITLSSAIRFLLAAAALAWVGWLSVTTYLPKAVPQMALFGADDPDLVFRQAGEQLLTNRGRIDEAVYARVAQAAQREPLAADPFIYFGMRAVASGDLPLAERLLVEARHRHPRNRLARMALVGVYLQTGRVQQGAQEVAVLTRIEPRANEFLAPELARLASSRSTEGAIVQAIGHEPVMAVVLDQLVKQGADPDLLLRLSRRQPRLPNGALATWQSRLLEGLTARGEVARAHQLWRSFVGAANRPGLIYDANFEGLPGPPPFNWELTLSDVGTAERASGPALEIQYFGRKSGPLARQLLLLAPGRYRLDMQVEGSASGEGSRIMVQVACREGSQALLNMPRSDLRAAY